MARHLTRHALLALVACGALLAHAAPARGQGAAVRGTVRDAGTGAPVAGARLQLRDPRGRVHHETATDTAGTFRLEAERAGRYFLDVRHDASATAESRVIELAAAFELVLEIRLGAELFQLEAITVQARPQNTERVREFRERAALNQGMGRGRIFTRREIEEINPRTAETLLATIPTARCRPEIRLDGVPATMPDLRSITPANLEGVEVYMGLEVPREFERPGQCGVALVWTRTRPEGMRELGLARVLVAGLFAAATFFLMR